MQGIKHYLLDFVSPDERYSVANFKIDAKKDDYTEQVWQINEEGIKEAQIFVPAMLKNGNDSYTRTGGTYENESFCYMDNQWRKLAYLNCFTVDGNLTTDPIVVNAIYAKPKEYVQINVGWNVETGEIIGNTDHTFSAADESGRLFILVEENCQWWEVEKVDGEETLFHCIHPLNNTYYYWGEDPTTLQEGWIEKRYTITWKNGEDVIVTYQLPRGTMAEYLGDNPTKPMDEGSTYTFIGWDPALAPVTDDATYTAVYAETPRKYTVTLKSDVEGACSFNGAGVYDYGTEDVAISATVVDPGYKFVAWEHDNTLGQSFTIDKITGDVTYTVRTEALPTLTLLRDGLTPGKMGTYTTAYDVNTYEGAEFYVPNQYTAGGIEFVSVDKLEAGTPYLFVATDNELWGLNEGTKVVADNVTKRGMVGYLGAGQVNVPEGSVVVIQNHLYYAKNNYMTAGYAYFDMTAIQALTPVQESADAPRRKLNIGFRNNAPTGMENIQGDNVQSTKVLIDGTLYILRNGNMYDVTGKLVK